jgi:CRISPR-associated endonuclease Csn1
MIYRDMEGNLKESIVTFWDVVQRLKNNESVYQLPDDGKEIVTTMEINDMFLIDIPQDYDLSDDKNISKYLYRVQKLSSNFYTFRHHLASTLNNTEEELRIQSMKAWMQYNPIKVKIDLNGKLI